MLSSVGQKTVVYFFSVSGELLRVAQPCFPVEKPRNIVPHNGDEDDEPGEGERCSHCAHTRILHIQCFESVVAENLPVKNVNVYTPRK
jgi:hypothetical protein